MPVFLLLLILGCNPGKRRDFFFFTLNILHQREFYLAFWPLKQIFPHFIQLGKCVIKDSEYKNKNHSGIQTY